MQFIRDLIYLTPLIGGRLADRYLGQRKAVFIGGILMALGQLALTQREFSVPGTGVADRRQRLLQAEHLDDGRHALPAGRRPA